MSQLIHKKDVDFSDLFPPNTDYEFFQERNAIPLGKDKPGECCLYTAWWLAESSLLSYTDPGFIKWVLRYIGAENYRFFSWKTTQVISFTVGKTCITAFRGTELGNSNAFSDIMSNLSFELVPFIGGGLVHRGFKEAFEECLDPAENLMDYLDSLLANKTAHRVLFTGHSLGGALATVAAAYYQSDRSPLYTYGAPRVGNTGFNALLPSEVYRFVNTGDPVPWLPPNRPGRANKEAVYTHSGEMCFFDKEQKLVFNPTDAPEHIGHLIGGNIKSTAKNLIRKAGSLFNNTKDSSGMAKKLQKFTVSLIRDSNLDAHAPILYASYIHNFLARQNML